MVDVLKTFLPVEVRDFVRYEEWSIKTPEGVERFQTRGGRVVPTLCVNGKVVCESYIPTVSELYDVLIENAQDEEQRAVLKRVHDQLDSEYESGGQRSPSAGFGE